MLQDALSGKSKVLMLVNVSPASYNMSETLCSLNFAARCRSVKLGAASKNEEPAEVARYLFISKTLHAQLVAAGITPSVSLDNSSASSNPSKHNSSKRNINGRR